MVISGAIALRSIISLVLFSLTGGVLLRFVISLYNGTKSNPAPNRNHSREQPPIEKPQSNATIVAETATQETNNPYAAPPASAALDVVSPTNTLAIPQPSFAKACLICFTAALSTVFVVQALRFWFGMSVIAGREKVIMERVFVVLPIPIAFIVVVSVFGLMLPTSLVKSVFLSFLFGVAAIIASMLITSAVGGLFYVFAS